ncbi:hypothetical protein GGI25_000620 [Coemansia spiralis]|uniref:Uncharacterized protein n=2 Tax=Coemansia TaxID=4863 RepID=A0A9W8L1A5_9FUNG|nr:hypothetical protein BX070DRAFT_254297 [Coemansia spiralis]KAJ1996077.1 hypothetical protein EDC05_000445 [Coemansia umbellata]KAJ2625520.1 hypothetical protein GGI26_000660 [Coemansia sp. RSA 1358]KAJ2680647.1 hypothetical protein GGI25_000620 [Coemansia spiralis]
MEKLVQLEELLYRWHQEQQLTMRLHSELQVLAHQIEIAARFPRLRAAKAALHSSTQGELRSQLERYHGLLAKIAELSHTVSAAADAGTLELVLGLTGPHVDGVARQIHKELCEEFRLRSAAETAESGVGQWLAYISERVGFFTSEVERRAAEDEHTRLARLL